MKRILWILSFLVISGCVALNDSNYDTKTTTSALLNREVAGWYNDGWNALSHQAYLDNHTLFSETNPYWYDLGTPQDLYATDGSISERGYAYTPQDVIDAHNNGDLVIPTIADHGVGQINAIINNPTAKANLINNIVSVVQNRNYDGFNLNFESGENNSRAQFTQFVNELASALHANNKKLSVTIKAVVNNTEENWYIFDLNSLGASAADRLKIMAYDKNFDKGANVPGPIAPINWVRNVLNYTINTKGVPSSKVQLALHNYAWTWKKVGTGDWQIMFPHDTYEGVQARCPSAAWNWNATALEHWKQCKVGGVTYRSYVGTSDTVMARIPLVDEFNLAGVAFWVLGKEDSSVYTSMCSYYGISCNSQPSVSLLSVNKPAIASSSFNNYYTPDKAVDTSVIEGWLANPAETSAWLQVDLQNVYTINQLKIYWGGYDWPIEYHILVSNDGQSWTTSYIEVNNNDGGTDTINLPGVQARYVKVLCVGPKSDNWSYEIYELEVYGF